jgi:hypothetical protein
MITDIVESRLRKVHETFLNTSRSVEWRETFPAKMEDQKASKLRRCFLNNYKIWIIVVAPLLASPLLFGSSADRVWWMNSMFILRVRVPSVLILWPKGASHISIYIFEWWKTMCGIIYILGFLLWTKLVVKMRMGHDSNGRFLGHRGPAARRHCTAPSRPLPLGQRHFDEGNVRLLFQPIEHALLRYCVGQIQLWQSYLIHVSMFLYFCYLLFFTHNIV